MGASQMNASKRKRVYNKYRKFTEKLNRRHEKLLDHGCLFSNMYAPPMMGLPLLDIEDTCETTSWWLNKLEWWGGYYVGDCEPTDKETFATRNNEAWLDK